ncbi:MAG: hypothetical protein ACD_39C00002G0001, partial [uncultured bacterium]
MKKLLLLLLAAGILFFPPLSVYLSTQTARQLQINGLENERQKVIDSQLRELEMPLSFDSSLEMHISRLSRYMHNQKTITGIDPERVAQSAEAGNFFKKFADRVIRNLDYPCEIAFILRREEFSRNIQVFRYGEQLGLEQILANFRNGALVDGNPLWSGYLASTLEQAANTLNNSTIVTMRSPERLLAIFSNSVGDKLQILAVADLHQISWLNLLEKKIICNNNIDYGLGCQLIGSSRFLYSEYFNDKPLLRDKIARFIAKAGPDPESATLSGYRIELAGSDQHKGARLFSVTAPILPESDNPRSQNLLMIALSALSVLSFILIGQKIALNRGFDLPIRYLIPVTFLLLFIQPLFSMVYLANEYLETSYSNIKSASSEKLTNDLISLDHQTHDNFLENLNVARGFRSIELINKYTGESYQGNDDFQYCLKLLRQIDKEMYNRYYSSLWMCRDDGKFTVLSLRADHDYQAEDSESDFTGFFNDRFVEVIDYLNNDCKPVINRQPSKIQDDLKVEYSRDFFLQIFGPDIFFNFRRYSPMLLDINTSYKKNKLLGMPITLHNRYFAYLTWHIDEKNARHNFPTSRLNLRSDSPRLAIFGSERMIGGLGFSLETLENTQPQLLTLARTAHINRSQSSITQKSDETIRINQAFPCNYSFFTVAGSETITSFSSWRRNFEQQALLFLAALSIVSFMLAMAGARYFTKPLRELTEATNQISAGNYQV